MLKTTCIYIKERYTQVSLFCPSKTFLIRDRYIKIIDPQKNMPNPYWAS